MRGELYIDGKDAYTDFGVWITEGGYDGLLPFPELVEPDRNDWPDEDGIEPDLEKPTLKPRELNIMCLPITKLLKSLSRAFSSSIPACESSNPQRFKSAQRQPSKQSSKARSI